MGRFKRNQGEESISQVKNAAQKPSAELRTRLKRLLQTDRKLGRKARSTDPAQSNYAFFSDEAQGSGSETWFLEYEIFALYMALSLLEHGWPQATAVSILRQARPQLEPKHKEILQWDPAELFDEKKLLESRRAGTPVVSTTRPGFLVIASRLGRPMERSSDKTREVRILEERELMPFLLREAGLSASVFELVTPAHNLRRALMNTVPSKRGRGSG